MSTAATRAAGRARNADIEAEILHLQRRISVLRIERAHNIQDRLVSYTYTVLTLPNEIISEIFIRLLPVYPLCPPMLGLLSPDCLIQICRKWREIALATPALWRAISLHCYRDDKGNRTLQLHMLRSRLRRSSYCSLSITVRATFMHSEEYARQILTAIVPHRARWEYLEVSDISLSNLIAIDGPLHLLRDLDILVYSKVLAPAAAFRQVPRLRAFTDRRHHCHNLTYLPDFLPWFQLTLVTLIIVAPGNCAPILTQTVNLVHCKLILWHGNANQPDIELPCLKSLVLIKFDLMKAVSHTPYLSTFVVPALRRLQVPDKYLGADPIDMLQSFISKSGCQLEEVCITGERSAPKASYRNAFPSIPKFTFNRALTQYKHNKGSDAGEAEESGDESE
ncbi:hypothetical protein C8R44DRAFT_882066 [Mycena epipterygia]|nr:hypothetical protein C8R44DRAFT_882066 [Mycena epipterygia]